MRSTLQFTKMKMPVAAMNGESSLPALCTYHGMPEENGNSCLSEQEGLYIGYGNAASSFPYRMQDLYSRELTDTDVRIAVLENDYLRAVFYPDMGGKLARLYDKEKKRDLLFFNPVIRPCNLALRNAWTSGGVEFNCGEAGHHHHTCDTIFTAQTRLCDGTPVLRFYAYERIRKCVYQMDFFLPTDSKLLFARMRLCNPNPYVTPAYWWSNMAVPEAPGSRVIVPADSAYTSLPEGVTLVPVPLYNGIDITYPTNNPHAVDYFFKIPEQSRKFEAQLDRDGYGLVQASTARLQGRKQFVWGQGPGGDRWQEYLTADGSDARYVEIQAGLAHTQCEHLPMPPRTTWEWLEAYGAMQADPAKIHGDWEDAKCAAEAVLDRMITEAQMDAILAETAEMATAPAQTMVLYGDGWAALENERRRSIGAELICPHLDFGRTDEEQAFWQALLHGTALPDYAPTEIPPSWMAEPYWTTKMEERTATDGKNYYLWLQLGMSLLTSGRHREAKEALERSVHLAPNPWAYYGLSKCASLANETDLAATLLLSGACLRPGDLSLAREALGALIAAGKYRESVTFYESQPADVRADGRATLLYVCALLRSGNEEKAEQLLLRDGGIVIADIREGEVLLTDLWFEIQERKAQTQGIPFDRNALTPPKRLDFRMKA